MSILDEQTQVPAEPAPIDGHVAVFVASGRVSAEVLVTAPAWGGRAATEDDVMTKLEEAGVQFGVDAEAVARAVEEARIRSDPTTLQDRIVVALGRPPVAGQDGRIDFHQTLTEAGGRPRVLPDGTVDLLDLNLVRNVTRDTVLAVITPAGPGEAGMTVTGVVIPPRPGRGVHLTAGKGTRLGDDRLTLIAAVDGHPTLVGSEVAVTDLYQVKEDVGVATGNIHFVGSVAVRGGINHGFKVKAEGDVEVQGAIDGGSVEAAGNVIVRYGITAGSRVVAGGSVRARFIESADVSAGTNIWAAEGILQSRVEAGDTIEVLGRRGAIIGGHTVARSAVSARVLGSPLGATTEITVGLSPRTHAEMLENQKKQAAAEAEFQRVDQAIQGILDRDRRGPIAQHRRLMLSKLAKEQEELFAALEELKSRGQALKHEAADARSAWVQANDVCHPGVRIGIGNVRYRVSDTLNRTRFRLDDASEIEAAPI